jgi:hypothetical protein
VELQFFFEGVTNKKGFLLKIFLQSMKFMNIVVELGFKRKKKNHLLYVVVSDVIVVTVGKHRKSARFKRNV